VGSRLKADKKPILSAAYCSLPTASAAHCAERELFSDFTGD